MTRSRCALPSVVGVSLAMLAGAWHDADAWPGVDESVVARFANEAGRSTAHPVIDWVRGDALLFAFLCAGLAAGFLLGFFGRALFVDGSSGGRKRGPEHA